MYYLLTALPLAYGIYTLAGQFITFPAMRTEKAMSSFKRKQSFGERFYNLITFPLIKLLSGFMGIEPYESRKLEKDLQRAGITLSPAEYKARAFVMENISTLKNVDIRTVDKTTLADISTVKINPNDSPEKKMTDYVNQIKNPYCFLCNGYAVKIEFANTGRTIEDCFSDYIDNLI